MLKKLFYKDFIEIEVVKLFEKKGLEPIEIEKSKRLKINKPCA